MKILHLSAVKKDWGGGENHIENLCRELQESHPEVQNFIFCVGDGKFHQRLQETTIPFVTAALGIKIDPRYVFKLISTCKKKKIDLIHIHDPTALTLAVIADKFADLPPFIFSKKTSFPIKQRKQTLFKYNYSKIRRILCVSEETKRIAAEGISDKTKLKTIYHGTNLTSKSDKTPFSLRKKLKISEEKKIVGNIANHIRAKNLETFVEMVNELVNIQQRTDLAFVQIGDFTDRTPALQQKLEDYQLEEHLFFLDFIPEASNFIPQFDILVMSSQSEGVPGVIYEAFYHGTPVVSTNVGGIPEIIAHNENGLLCPAHVPRELAKNVANLAENEDLCRKFAEIAKKRLLENYTTAKMAEATLKEYKKVLDERRF